MWFFPSYQTSVVVEVLRHTERVGGGGVKSNERWERCVCMCWWNGRVKDSQPYTTQKVKKVGPLYKLIISPSCRTPSPSRHVRVVFFLTFRLKYKRHFLLLHKYLPPHSPLRPRGGGIFYTQE